MARVGYPVKPRRRRSCCEPPTSFGPVHSSRRRCRPPDARRARVHPRLPRVVVTGIQVRAAPPAHGRARRTRAARRVISPRRSTRRRGEYTERQCEHVIPRSTRRVSADRSIVPARDRARRRGARGAPARLASIASASPRSFARLCSHRPRHASDPYPPRSNRKQDSSQRRAYATVPPDLPP